jgi:hypothetical protein
LAIRLGHLISHAFVFTNIQLVDGPLFGLGIDCNGFELDHC